MNVARTRSRAGPAAPADAAAIPTRSAPLLQGCCEDPLRPGNLYRDTLEPRIGNGGPVIQPAEGEDQVSVVGSERSKLPAVDPVRAARKRLEKDLGFSFADPGNACINRSEPASRPPRRPTSGTAFHRVDGGAPQRGDRRMHGTDLETPASVSAQGSCGPARAVAGVAVRAVELVPAGGCRGCCGWSRRSPRAAALRAGRRNRTRRLIVRRRGNGSHRQPVRPSYCRTIRDRNRSRCRKRPCPVSPANRSSRITT